MKKRQAMLNASNARKDCDRVLLKKFRCSPCNFNFPDSPHSLSSKELDKPSSCPSKEQESPPNHVLPDSLLSIACKDLNEKQDQETPSQECDYPAASCNIPGCSVQDLSKDCCINPLANDLNGFVVPSKFQYFPTSFRETSSKQVSDVKKYFLNAYPKDVNEKHAEGISRQDSYFVPAASLDMSGHSAYIHEISRNSNGSLYETQPNLYSSHFHGNSEGEYYSRNCPLNLTSEECYRVHYSQDGTAIQYSSNLNNDDSIPMNLASKDIFKKLNEHTLKDSDHSIANPSIPVNATFQGFCQNLMPDVPDQCAMNLASKNIDKNLDKVLLKDGSHMCESSTKYSSVDDIACKFVRDPSKYSILSLSADVLPGIPNVEVSNMVVTSRAPPVSCCLFSLENIEKQMPDKSNPSSSFSKDPDQAKDNHDHTAAFNFLGTSVEESNMKLNQNLSKDCPINLTSKDLIKLNENIPKECGSYSKNPNSLSDETVQEESTREVDNILSQLGQESLNENDHTMIYVSPNDPCFSGSVQNQSEKEHDQENNQLNNVFQEFPSSSNDPCSSSEKNQRNYQFSNDSLEFPSASNEQFLECPTPSLQNNAKVLDQEGIVLEKVPCLVDLTESNALIESCVQKPANELPKEDLPQHQVCDSQSIATPTLSVVQEQSIPLTDQTLSEQEKKSDILLGGNRRTRKVRKENTMLLKKLAKRSAQSSLEKNFSVLFDQSYILHYIRKGYKAILKNKTCNWKKVYNRYLYSSCALLDYKGFLKIVNTTILRHEMVLKLHNLRCRLKKVLEEMEAEFRSKKKVYYDRHSYVLANTNDYNNYVTYVRNARVSKVKLIDNMHMIKTRVRYGKNLSVLVDALCCTEARMAVRNAEKSRVVLHPMGLRI